ncbi:MAG: hypothetical protein WDW36_004603 [Sanguina aurantia]
MGKRSRSAAGQPSFEQFVNSYTKVQSWFSKGAPLRERLEQAGGLLRIEHFLPLQVADGILSVLEGVGPKQWSQTAAAQDYKQNNISHQFWSTKQGPGLLSSILRMFSSGLFPEEFSTFSAARYEGGHHIAPHDDRAHAEVRLEDGGIQVCSRDIAVIYYLTKDWRLDMGGALVDLEDPGGHRTYVPIYNSAVVFLVPRFHQVTPVTAARPRFSIFGWSLHPGALYELMTAHQDQSGGSSDSATENEGSPEPAASTQPEVAQEEHIPLKKPSASGADSGSGNAEA